MNLSHRCNCIWCGCLIFQIQGASLSEKSASTTTPRADSGIPTSSNVTTIKTSQPHLPGSAAFLMSTNSPVTSGSIGGPVGGIPSAGLGVPAGGKAAPILISLPINGQLTSVLVDPVTMQVTIYKQIGTSMKIEK